MRLAGRRGGDAGPRNFIERAGGRRLIAREDLERVSLEEAARVRGELSSVRVVRPADLLALTFGFRNLELRPQGGGKPPLLARRVRQQPAYLIVEFPSQHITEKAFFESAAGLPPAATRDTGLPPDHKDARNPNHPGDPERDVGNAGSEIPIEAPPVRSLIGGPSRLVFRVLDEEIPYTLEGLLEACSLLKLRVAEAARPRSTKSVLAGLIAEFGLTHFLVGQPKFTVSRGNAASELVAAHRMLRATAQLTHRLGTREAAVAIGGSRGVTLFGSLREEFLAERKTSRPTRPPQPGDPGPERTGIELPWRLIVSPHDGAAFAHSPAPVKRGERFELWHSRLGLRAEGPDGASLVDERDTDNDRTMRAIWTRDFEWFTQPTPENMPAVSGTQDKPGFRMALNANDRISIVHLTADWTLDRSVANDNTVPYEPDPVDVKRMMLSSLGGWLDSYGAWGQRPDGVSVEEWRHRAAMGRDFEVRVVRAGFLFPLGHRASLIKVTERKFHPEAPGTPAYLFQRMFIVVRERTRTYGGQKLEVKGVQGRTGERIDFLFPFKSVTLTTRVTPLLDEPVELFDSAPLTNDHVFFPHVENAPFDFKVIAVDIEDNTLEFGTPLLFVGSAHNLERDRIKTIARAYDKHPRSKTGSLSGQRLAFAPSDKPDDTVLSVEALYLGGDEIEDIGSGQTVPTFAPRVRKAEAVVPALANLAGNAAPVALAYADGYRKVGFGGTGAEKNNGQVFLKVDPDSGTLPTLDFNRQADRSGGLVAPSLAVSGLSRLTGPISGEVEDFAGGGLDPAKFFEGIDAKLFGAIKLTELVKPIGLDVARMPKFVSQTLDSVTVLTADLEQLVAQVGVAGGQATQVEQRAQDLIDGIVAWMDPASANPELAPVAEDLGLAIDAVLPTLGDEPAKRPLDALLRRVKAAVAEWPTVKALLESFSDGLKLPEVVTSRLEWRPSIQAVPTGAPIFIPNSPADGFVVAVDVHAPTSPSGEPAVDVTCTLSNFKLQLLGGDAAFLILNFQSIQFLVRAGKKADVSVEFEDLEFAGCLEFVNNLKDLIPLDGFSDPPSLEVGPEGITAAFSLALPNVSVGVFSLENISLGAKLRVPFIGESIEVGFFFCTREDPFRLTVMMFGGGGFVGVTVTPDGVKLLEAALEFGAAVSLDFGVASGSLSIMAGIYFRMELQPEEKASLTGYFRARGELDVLGLISASIELYLELTYEFQTKKCVGRATLTIEVEVLMFSGSVEISCEKKFAGSAGDPTFEQVMGRDEAGNALPHPTPWDEYAQAFAEVA
jgi:hypothetical protein